MHYRKERKLNIGKRQSHTKNHMWPSFTKYPFVVLANVIFVKLWQIPTCKRNLASWASGGASEVDFVLPSFSPKTQSGFFCKDFIYVGLLCLLHESFHDFWSFKLNHSNTSWSLVSSSNVNSFFFTVLSWVLKLNLAASFCNLANLFSYFETFLSDGLMLQDVNDFE